jgi:transposase
MTLEELMVSNPDPRELKRALVIKMRLQGMKHREIRGILPVHSSYISRWEKKYQEGGVENIRLGHKGSQGLLNKKDRLAVIQWIEQKSERGLWEVIDHLENCYGVVYRSMQSYYDLLKTSGMSWQKGKKKVPDMMNRWYVSTTK